MKTEVTVLHKEKEIKEPGLIKSFYSHIFIKIADFIDAITSDYRWKMLNGKQISDTLNAIILEQISEENKIKGCFKVKASIVEENNENMAKTTSNNTDNKKKTSQETFSTNSSNQKEKEIEKEFFITWEQENSSEEIHFNIREFKAEHFIKTKNKNIFQEQEKFIQTPKKLQIEERFKMEEEMYTLKEEQQMDSIFEQANENGVSLFPSKFPVYKNKKNVKEFFVEGYIEFVTEKMNLQDGISLYIKKENPIVVLKELSRQVNEIVKYFNSKECYITDIKTDNFVCEKDKIKLYLIDKGSVYSSKYLKEKLPEFSFNIEGSPAKKEIVGLIITHIYIIAYINQSLQMEQKNQQKEKDKKKEKDEYSFSKEDCLYLTLPVMKELKKVCQAIYNDERFEEIINNPEEKRYLIAFIEEKIINISEKEPFINPIKYLASSLKGSISEYNKNIENLACRNKKETDEFFGQNEKENRKINEEIMLIFQRFKNKEKERLKKDKKPREENFFKTHEVISNHVAYNRKSLKTIEDIIQK